MTYPPLTPFDIRRINEWLEGPKPDAGVDACPWWGGYPKPCERICAELFPRVKRMRTAGCPSHPCWEYPKAYVIRRVKKMLKLNLIPDPLEVK